MSLKATCLSTLSHMQLQQSPASSASSLFALRDAGIRRQIVNMRSCLLLLLSLLLVSRGSSAVITGACEKDTQCGGGMCCAVSLWIRSLHMCTPMGQDGDDCHPLSHKIPFYGKRLHHTCPCLPNLECVTIEEGRSKCLSPQQYPDYFL